MRRYLFTTAILPLMLTCTGNPNTSTDDGIEEISFLDLARLTDIKNVEKNKTLLSADIISDVRYIPLETTKESLIANIGKMQIDSGILFISDAEQPRLMVFDSLGRFKNTIGRQGNGPGEYIHLYSFYLDRNRKQVGILDNVKRKTLIYDYEGNHLRDIEYAEQMLFPYASSLSSDGVVLMHYPIPDGYMESSYEYQLARENQGKYEILDDFAEYRFKNPPRYGAVSGTVGSISYSKTETLFAPHFSNMIYSLKERQITPGYRVDTPKSLAEGHFFRSNRDRGYFELTKIMTEQNLFGGINKIIETPRYLFLLLENRYTGLWDKNSKKGICFEWTFDEPLNRFQRLMESAFYTADGNRMIGFSQASLYLDNKEGIDRGGDEALIDLANSLTENSNPVILSYTLKPDLINSLFDRFSEDSQ